MNLGCAPTAADAESDQSVRHGVTPPTGRSTGQFVLNISASDTTRSSRGLKPPDGAFGRRFHPAVSAARDKSGEQRVARMAALRGIRALYARQRYWGLQERSLEGVQGCPAEG